MSRRGESNRPKIYQENQFQTPHNPRTATPARSTTSGHSKKTFSSSSSSSSSRRRRKSPFSSASTSKFSNTTFSSPSDQTTLTQIAFLTNPREPNLDDGRFDYIEENDGVGRDGPQPDAIVIDSDSEPENENDSNGHNDNSNTASRLPRARRVRTVRFEEGSNFGDNRGSKKDFVCKPKKNTHTNPEVKKVGARKTNSNNKKNKDKTLTQMKFVYPIIHIKSDGDEDDANLDYISYSPKKEERKEKQERQSDDKVEGDLDQDTVPRQEYSKYKRRRLNDGLDRLPRASSNSYNPSHKRSVEVKKEDATYTEGSPPRNPVTPQKTRKFEIPSSQSPVSPGLAVISPSQFRSSVRCPLKSMSPNARMRHIGEEGSPTSRAQRKPSTLDSHLASTIGGSTVSASSTSLKSPILGQRTLDENAGSKPSPNDRTSKTECKPSTFGNDASKGHQTEGKAGSFEGKVVYETDAESDYDDIGNELLDSDLLQQEQQAIAASKTPTIDSKETLVNNDSQGQDPPAIPSDADFEESAIPTSESPISSNASICYRRQQPSTQFPAEPIPVLNTQKIAELFPQEESTMNASQLQPRVSIKPEIEPPPTSPTQTQYPTRPQTQFQDLEKLSAEIVPESSPVAQRDSNESVVQVESSQPADRLRKQSDIDQSSGPQGILSGNRLLPPSLMDSIAVPVFWMGSQDSVGEQYSLPEG